MTTWVYFASDRTTDLPSTLEAVLGHHVLWRPALAKDGRPVTHVATLSEGDWLLVAWRQDRHAYLKCRVGAPSNPVNLKGKPSAIDTLPAEDAKELAALGYEPNSAGFFELLRIEEVAECHMALGGAYGGNNTLHRATESDVLRSESGGPIPSAAKARLPRTVSTRRKKPRERGPQATPGIRGQAPEVHAYAAASSPDSVSIPGPAPRRAFDAYIMVDWSSKAEPATGNDSIWVAQGRWETAGFHAGSPINLATRVLAAKHIELLVRPLVSAGSRVLVGMDFAFGYPSGLAAALSLPVQQPWLSLHKHIAKSVTDDTRNCHNRDAFADACNRAIRPNGPGPFWGCTSKAVTSHLTQRRVGAFQFPYAGGLEEWRLTEREATKRTVTQSVWKINCGVSVGGQTIMGIKHLHELATILGGRRWPFDTGWTIPPIPSEGNGCVWFAEVFPSLVQYPEWKQEYQSQRDRTQVQSCVRYAAEHDFAGTLKAFFERPAGLGSAEEARVLGEEGWILFV